MKSEAKLFVQLSEKVARDVKLGKIKTILLANVKIAR